MSADAQACLECYFVEIAARFPEGFNRHAGGASAVEDFVPPYGCLLLAKLDGQSVGCGAIRAFNSDVGEIKRMWVSPRVRGQGVGRQLLGELEQFARSRQWRAVRLDTNASLHEAVGLYLRSGYREIDRFNDNPYAHRWFEKSLDFKSDPPGARWVSMDESKPK